VPSSLNEARTLNNLSDVLQRLGRFDEALSYAAQAEAIWRERTGVSLGVAELRFQRATALGNLGRWPRPRRCSPRP
jgi:tetratricopeptide (TPR) repeat protein